MNEFETNSDLGGQVAALQRQVFLLLLALIVVTGSLTVYLWYQSHEISKNVDSLQTQIIDPFNKRLPAIKTTANELIAFGNTHPQYRAILVKYGFETNAVPPAK
ncbi:MAG: hypothetical protein ACLQSR_02830 [Limisphaerales bacterium]